MWWKQGHLENWVFSVPKDFKIQKAITIIIILFGFRFPLVGLSLLIVFFLDWLVLKRIPRLKQWILF
jgi:uncharacterized iron-regulated membrane protein